LRILSKEDATELLNGKSLDDYISELSGQLQLVKGAYSTPTSSLKHIALSNLFVYLLFRDSPVCIYITGWGVATSMDVLDLFYGYRRSHGESRPLMEAPVHVFEPIDHDALISVFRMVFFFFWDAWLIDLAGRSLLRLSHDGWLEVRARDESIIKEVAVELKDYDISLLHR
jgi:hypothetical protein